MFKLFRENVRIALESIKSQLLRTILTIVIIAIGIWALVGILSAVKALETTISSSFASMGSNTFNIQRYSFQTQRHGGGERQKVNPIISYDLCEGFNFVLHRPRRPLRQRRARRPAAVSIQASPRLLPRACGRASARAPRPALRSREQGRWRRQDRSFRAWATG